jgi:hypothetical protein
MRLLSSCQNYRPSTGAQAEEEVKALIVIGLAILVFLVIAVIYGIGGLFFMLMWNFLMPHLWHAAPHLTWVGGITVSWIIGILQSIFGRTVTVKS